MDWCNYESVLAAVTNNGAALEYTDDALKSNFNIVMAAVTQNENALFYADKALKCNEEFIAECLHVNRDNENKCNDIWTNVNEEIVKKYEGTWQNLWCSYYLK